MAGAFRSSIRRLAVSAQAPTTSTPIGLLTLPPIGRTKQKTSIVGLAVHPSPFAALLQTYDSTLATLAKVPAGAVYRQSVEAVIRHRRGIVAPFAEANAESGEDIEGIVARVEAQLGAGLIEEVILQAQDEKDLAEKMVEWKAWEDLEEKPAPNQWRYFEVAPSNTNPPQE